MQDGRNTRGLNIDTVVLLLQKNRNYRIDELVWIVSDYFNVTHQKAREYVFAGYKRIEFMEKPYVRPTVHETSLLATPRIKREIAEGEFIENAAIMAEDRLLNEGDENEGL